MKLIILAYLTLFTLLNGCAYPHWKSDSFAITATYHSNNKCSFAVNGVMISDSQYRQSISGPDSCVGCTEDGFDGYFVFCESDSISSLKMNDPYPPEFIMHIVVTENSRLDKGEYIVSEVKGIINNTSTTASLLRHPDYGHSSILNGFIGAKLVGVSGSLNLTEDFNYKKNIRGQNPNSGIEANLSIVAQRRMAGF